MADDLCPTCGAYWTCDCKIDAPKTWFIIPTTRAVANDTSSITYQRRDPNEQIIEIVPDGRSKVSLDDMRAMEREANRIV